MDKDKMKLLQPNKTKAKKERKRKLNRMTKMKILKKHPRKTSHNSTDYLMWLELLNMKLK